MRNSRFSSGSAIATTNRLTSATASGIRCLGVLPLTRRARVLAGYPNRLLTLLQKASLIHDEYSAILLAQMLDDVFKQVVADGICVTAGGVQKTLCSLRSALSYLFGHLPAVLALYASEQSSEGAAGSLPYLGPLETTSDAGAQIAKGSLGHCSTASSSLPRVSSWLCILTCCSSPG
jgi:hypothetical protein